MARIAGFLKQGFLRWLCVRNSLLCRRRLGGKKRSQKQEKIFAHMWLKFPSLQSAAVILVNAKIVCHFETSVISRIKVVGKI